MPSGSLPLSTEQGGSGLGSRPTRAGPSRISGADPSVRPTELSSPVSTYPTTEGEMGMPQGPWTRIRPLQIDEVDDHTAAAYMHGQWTWGHFPNNLMKMMGHC